MALCEVCEGPAEKSCGYGGAEATTWLDFCTEDYIDHLESAHPSDDAAQKEAKELRAALKKSERGLLAQMKERK